MRKDFHRVLILVSILVMFLLIISQNSYAKKKSYTVKVVPVDGEPFIINDFTQNNRQCWFAAWHGSCITIDFEKVKSVNFLNPGDSEYPVEIVFKDGKRSKFNLAGKDINLYGKSDFGYWVMSAKEVKAIVFDVSSDSESSPYIAGDTDLIILKNGDKLSGDILDESFSLKTSYASLVLRTQDIKSIEFEGGGLNIDVVKLKVGDKLSGIVHNTSVRIKLLSGRVLNIDLEKVKSIYLKD